MPGFTSVLLGHGAVFSLRPDTPPQSDNDSELEAPLFKKRRLNQERRRARQGLRLYGTIWSRQDMTKMQSELQNLEYEISAQIERYHDLGLARHKQVVINKFKKEIERVDERVQLVLKKFEHADWEGAVKELGVGAGELRRIGVLGVNGKGMNMLAVRELVTVYQRLLIVPLKQLRRDVKDSLGNKGGWKDPK
ncbi:hypothetical protein GMOD_00002298 [Pyrenophora seminiperda CCB06]|uniref:Uncharacterized protein n=1 Tax=Pyrenophora seminiperda CCB06 TaxID=1302712 RepID=A0A3M7LXJ9_9PLEO|nr:hypothetical protein GMOD_00002298 [Pyrenophora seminiperda CCB06]